VGRILEDSIAVLNGAIGHYLSRTNNELATPFRFLDAAHEGSPVSKLDAKTRTVAVFVHGLMCSESIWRFPREDRDYGTLLARDLGVLPIYARYNTGLPIHENGAELSRALESLVASHGAEPLEILPIGYSMGGLVVRSACHVARAENHRWLERVQRAVYVGTPHNGAPAERAGRVVAKILRAIDDPYTRLVADVADLRSDGIRDLGDADLRPEDRATRAARLLRDESHPVPLLPSIRHYLIAGALSDDPILAALFGDAVVPVSSATNSPLPRDHVKILPGLSHVDLAHHERVYDAMISFLRETP
jgi:pimeloyl-ACP methyl ester carboxylesterase